jgi:hypothetical protein
MSIVAVEAMSAIVPWLNNCWKARASPVPVPGARFVILLFAKFKFPSIGDCPSRETDCVRAAEISASSAFQSDAVANIPLTPGDQELLVGENCPEPLRGIVQLLKNLAHFTPY